MTEQEAMSALGRPFRGSRSAGRCARHGAARCQGGLAVAGSITRVGAEWLLLDEGGNREALVVTATLISVSGLGRLSAVPDTEGVVESRLGLRHALRGIARDRSTAAVHLIDGTTADGTIDRIGADFVEIAAHAAGGLRRRGDVRDVLVVPLSAV